MPVRPRHAARNRRPGFWRQWTLWLYFPLALLLALGGVCLYRSGHWLVADDPAGKVSWAVVLAGESREGERSDAALKLYLEGRIDTTIYSATRIFKDTYGGGNNIEYLVREGYPPEKLFLFPNDSYSTQEEATLLIRQFRYQNLDTVLIITSNYHSARARRIFRKLAQGYPHILVHAADFNDFDPSAWWSGRESRKYWLIEWIKTVSTFFELMSTPPETGKSETNGLTGASGRPVDTLPPLPVPAASPSAPPDSAASDATSPGDTGVLPQASPAATAAPADSTSDSARVSAAGGTSAKTQAADSAPAPKAPAPVRETAKKDAKGNAKDTGASKPSGSKAPAKTAGKKASTKAPEKEKEKKKSSR